MSKKKTKDFKGKSYIAPAIEVVEIEIEQNVLAGGSGDGNLQGLDGEPW